MNRTTLETASQQVACPPAPFNPFVAANDDLSRFKLDANMELADLETTILPKPDFFAPQAIAVNAIPKEIGLVVTIESTGYNGDPNARFAQILPGWSVEKFKRIVGDAIKLLIYYHPDASPAVGIEAFVNQVADDCGRYDLAIMWDPLYDPLNPAAKTLASDENACPDSTHYAPSRRNLSSDYKLPRCRTIGRKQRINPLVTLEDTCNLVNQFGGYPGMTPAQSVQHVGKISEVQDCPRRNLILGGEYLRPMVRATR